MHLFVDLLGSGPDGRRRRVGGSGLAGTLLSPALGLALLVSPASAEQSCPDFVDLIGQAAPAEIGSPALVAGMLAASVPASSQLSANFDSKARDISRFLGLKLKAGRDCVKAKERAADTAEQGQDVFACEYRDKRSDALLRADMEEGRLVFLDPARSFDPAGPDNDVTAEEGTAVAGQVAEAFGLPLAEVDLDKAVPSFRERAANVPGGGNLQKRQIETNIDVFRQVGGHPVMGSRLRVAVGNDRRPARIHVDWPDFSLASGLEAGTAIDRESVIAEAATALAQDAACGTIKKVGAIAAYVDRRLLGIADVSDDDQDSGFGRYAPALVVFAFSDDETSTPNTLATRTAVVAAPLLALGEQNRG